jgi:hypothetical protein
MQGFIDFIRKQGVVGLAIGFMLWPLSAFGAAYIKFDGVDGEASTTSAPARAVATPTPTPQAGRTDALLEIDTIKGESTKDGAPAIEPDEIDVMDGDEPLTPDFSILLGGGSDDSEEAATARQAVEDILKQGADEAGMPVEEISLNFEKIKVSVEQPVKLLGFIEISTTADVEIDDAGRIKVKFPWWAVFASKGNAEALGEDIAVLMSDIIRAKHDTIKNSIGNIR